MLPMSSFRTICDKCRVQLEDGDEYNCNYWLHKKEKYGNANLIRNYCKNCVKEFTLYDGRKDFLCEVCQKYVPIFNKFPKFLEICQYLDCYDFNYDLGSFDENTEASNVCNVMNNFGKLLTSEIEVRLQNIDFDEAMKYITENY